MFFIIFAFFGYKILAHLVSQSNNNNLYILIKVAISDIILSTSMYHAESFLNKSFCNFTRGDIMESGIVTVFVSMATVSTIFAIILGLGKKYHDQDLKKTKELSKY